MKTESPSPAACADSCQCEDQVRDYAYHLYEQSNRVPGRDVENWLEASACLRARIPVQESGSRLHRHLGEHEFSGSAESAIAIDPAGTVGTAVSVSGSSRPASAAPAPVLSVRAKR